MKMPSLPQVTSVSVVTFLGGLGTYLVSHGTQPAPTNAQGWIMFAVGAIAAGGSAILHLYQTNPSDAKLLKMAKMARSKGLLLEENGEHT